MSSKLSKPVERLERTFDNFCKWINPRFFVERDFFLSIVETTISFLKQTEKDLLMINLPQSTGKSYFANLLSAWLIGIDPTLSILRVNSTQSRANDFTRAISVLMNDDKFQKFFEYQTPKLTIDNAKEIWLTGNWNASYRGVGADVSTMSARANLFLIDDVYENFADAVNLRYNKKLQTKWTTEWVGRLEGSNMKVISVGTRYSKSDFYAYLEKSLKLYKAIRIPALDEKGQSFCEHVRTTEKFQELKRITNEDIWNAVYQQQPSAEGQIPIFQGYEFARANTDGLTFDFTISVADPSFGVGADYFACGIFGLHGKSVFLLDVLYSNKITYQEYFDFIDKHNPRYRFMEANGVGSIWINEIVKARKHKGLQSYHSTGDKYVRIFSEQDRVKQIVFNESLSPTLFEVLEYYPDVENDDFPDMLAAATRIISNNFFVF